MKKTIKLYGELGKRFGKEFSLDVKTPAEAIRALIMQIKGMRKYLEDNSEPGYVIKVGKEEKDLNSLMDPVSYKEVISIIPQTVGAGGNTGKIILGIVLVAFIIWNPMGLTWIGMSQAVVQAGSSALMNFGASLLMSGIASLLAPSPEVGKGPDSPDATPSYMFDGPVNTMGPGYCVPVGYGELIIGSQVISAELFSVEEAI